MMKKDDEPLFVSFRMIDDECIAAVPLAYIQEGVITRGTDLKGISRIYKKKIIELKNMLKQIELKKTQKIALPSLFMWDFGDKILSLVDAINSKKFEIDNLYEHLIRDLDRKRGWLEKVIIFRRSLPNRKLIPHDLKWSVCRDAPKKSAELILNGKNPTEMTKNK